MLAPDPVAVRLDRQLDLIHGLLRRGDLAALPEATAAMEADLAALRGDGASAAGAAVLGALRQKLERNALCLQGTARGIRAARRRIAEVRGAALSLGAYDASGQRLAGAAPTPSLARRF